MNYFNHLLALLLMILLACVPAEANAAVVIFLTSGTSFTVPSDFTTVNTIECIGAGNAGNSPGIALGGSGGGGGAYAQVSNLSLSGSITYQIAIASTLQDTYFNGAASTSASISCAAGRNASGATGGAGGKTANSTGTVKFAGGNGGGRSAGAGGGGGGAAGPNGAGVNGSGQNGGAGDAGFGGAGGVGSIAGGFGFEWNYVGGGGPAGAGGGGGGADAQILGNGGDGGFYGAGGGGGGTDGTEPGVEGLGADGIIVVTYFPLISSMIQVYGGSTNIKGGQIHIF